MKIGKKVSFGFFAAVSCIALLSMSCTQASETPTEKLLKENPVTISWTGNAAEVESLSANVNVYSMSNRKGNSFQLMNKYQMSMKNINGNMCSRVDTDKELTGISKSVLSDGKVVVVYNSDTKEVESRTVLPVDAQSTSELDFLTASPLTGRVNLEDVKSNANRLALDTTEENDGKSLVIKIPSSMVNVSEGVTNVSAKVTLDVSEETLQEVEIVNIERDGSVVTTTSTPIYEDVDGNLVKVGTITVLDTKDPNLITGFNDDVETFDSMDDIPELSKEEFEELNEQGLIHEIPDVTLGDPSDLSSVETYVELYEYVELNSVSDEAFRLLESE